MKASQIHVGGHYLARVSGKFVTVRVDRIYETANVFVSRSKMAYSVTNLSTGRKLVFRTPRKFRSVVGNGHKLERDQTCTVVDHVAVPVRSVPADLSHLPAQGVNVAEILDNPQEQPS